MSESTPTPPAQEPLAPTKALVSAVLGIVALITQGLASGEPWWAAVLAALGFGTVTGGAVWQATNRPRTPR